MTRGRAWAYWTATGLFCLAMLAGGVMDVLVTPNVKEVFTHLGYPLVLARILGLWKILGVAALLLPGWRRLKEWAYAGFTFDLSSAAISHMWIGDPVVNVVGPAGFLIMMVTSYVLRPASRRL